ncbi:FliH/SctL family protein [Tissierella sp. MB52-C2]|uniref:FliH/SctL family protein n=1 Tax=Tissierella sp. MB52-C2 TaxID=3070999 RepID=UPI00280C1653|nr:FliH/SctL family protein [Tissierella sp. MB52-C2]WMM26624.1 FliH/SctL family protein [Tissierella sp. MB52-C2]
MSNVIKSFRVIETESKKIIDDSENKKVIEKIIEDAREEAEKEYEIIIDEAKEEALKIIEDSEGQKESMINDAYVKAKEILEEHKAIGYDEGHEAGYKGGYEKGYNEGKVESSQLIKEALDIKNDYISTKDKLLKELEEDIIELVINIYEKVIDKKTEEDNELIVSLVLNGISNLDLTDKLTIVVSKEDYNILEMAKEEILAKASMITELDIKYDISLVKGDCILETSKGNIDASLENQLEEVKELLTTILNNE